MASRRSPLPLLLAVVVLISVVGAAWVLLGDDETTPSGGGAPVVATEDSGANRPADLPTPLDLGPPPEPAEPPPARAGGLTGMVVDHNRSPVTEAKISLHRGTPGHLPGLRDLPELGLRATVDGNGRFSFSDVPAGDLVTVRVIGDGFQPADYGPYAVQVAEITDAGRIVVELGLRISGVVLGPDNRPQGGATVALGLGSTPRRGEPDPVPLAETTTDDLGRFVIEHGPRSPFKLVARAPGFGRCSFSQSHALPFDVPSVEVTLQLTPAKTLRGHVESSADGSPLADIEVRVVPMGVKSSWYLRATTGKDGAFAIEDMAVGPVRFSADGHGWIRRQLDSPADVFDEGIVLKLDPAGTIEGRVVDQAGEPIRAYDLQPRRSNKRGIIGEALGARRVRDSKGRFSVDDLDPGWYLFEVWAKDHAISIGRPVLLKPGTLLRGVQVQMQASAALVGRVVDDAGNPIAGADVSLHTDTTPRSPFLRQSIRGVSWYQRTRTDLDGRFEMRDVTEQTYQVEVDHRDHPIHYRDGVTVIAGQVTETEDFVLPRSATVLGAVIDANGQAVIGAKLSIGGGDSNMTSRETVTDGKGRYRFDRLEPGPYSLQSLSRKANPMAHISTVLKRIKKDEDGKPYTVPDVVLVAGEVREHTVIVDT